MSIPGRIVATQALIGLCCIAVLAALDEGLAGATRSAALALAATLIPSLYYAWVVQRSLRPAQLLMHGVLRMVGTLTLMAVAIVRFGVEPVGFFVTFALLQLAYLVPVVSRD
ncbi:MAG: hypothetical protein AAF513_16380 [Pseudomonadota bacterium]